jgi:hypothetical protein
MGGDKIRHPLSNLLAGEQLYLKKSSLERDEAIAFIKGFDQWQEKPQNQVLYKPAVYAEVEIQFNYKRANIHVLREFYLATPLRDFYPFVDWSQSFLQISKMDLEAVSQDNGLYDIFPTTLNKVDNLTELEKELKEHLYRDNCLVIYYNLGLQIYSSLKESLEEFQIKCEGLIDEKIRDDIENLRSVYQRRFDQIEKELMNESDTVISDPALSDRLEYIARKREELLTIGEPILSFLQGRRPLSEIIQAGKMHVNSKKVKTKADKSTDVFNDLHRQLYNLNFELEDDVAAIDERFKEYLKLTEKIQIRPEKSDITIYTMGILWIPF